MEIYELSLMNNYFNVKQGHLSLPSNTGSGVDLCFFDSGAEILPCVYKRANCSVRQTHYITPFYQDRPTNDNLCCTCA